MRKMFVVFFLIFIFTTVMRKINAIEYTRNFFTNLIIIFVDSLKICITIFDYCIKVKDRI